MNNDRVTWKGRLGPYLGEVLAVWAFRAGLKLQSLAVAPLE